MSNAKLKIGARVALAKAGFDQLLSALQAQGYETVGPQVQGDVLAYGPISGLEDLPRGYTSQQDGGHYRLLESGHSRYFDITPGADGWKRFLFPPRSELFKLVKENGSWQPEVLEAAGTKRAFIGVRGCELAAILVQDKVFLREDFQDPIYANRRENIFIVAVDCLHPCDTCFCASMGTGPQAGPGFDLRLTELDDVFLMEAGSAAGVKLASDLNWELARQEWLEAAEAGLAAARAAMGRELPDAEAVPALLLNNLQHPRWAEVAARCLSCTSCTQVCPTCFCWDVEDSTSLDGNATERTRVWDSCFNPSFSGVAGGTIRPDTHSRYRQWLTHKMGSWVGQFDVLGCVGCGRCITWCPAGIDLTEEIAAIRATQAEVAE